MRVLAIETATERVAVAIGDETGAAASIDVTRERHHAEVVTPAIEFLCRHLGIDLAGIDVVAVDKGPGLFTGVRVGMATAKAIAFAQGIPAVALSSLEILALGARAAGRPIVAVVDSRRSDVVYAAKYRPDAEGLEQLAPPSAVSPGALAERIAATGEECVVVGTGAVRFAHFFAGVPGANLAGRELAFPSARTLVAAAAARALRGETVSEAALEPLYLGTSSVRD